MVTNLKVSGGTVFYVVEFEKISKYFGFLTGWS